MIAILQQVLVQRMKNAAETEAALRIRLDKDLAEVKNNQQVKDIYLGNTLDP
mgnify:CR=1 FL=1